VISFLSRAPKETRATKTCGGLESFLVSSSRGEGIRKGAVGVERQNPYKPTEKNTSRGGGGGGQLRRTELQAKPTHGRRDPGARTKRKGIYLGKRNVERREVDEKRPTPGEISTRGPKLKKKTRNFNVRGKKSVEKKPTLENRTGDSDRQFLRIGPTRTEAAQPHKKNKKQEEPQKRYIKTPPRNRNKHHGCCRQETRGLGSIGKTRRQSNAPQ